MKRTNKLNFKKLKEGFYDDEYRLPKPYVRQPLNTMDDKEQAIFDSIVSAATKGMTQKEIERIIKKAYEIAFDPNSPSILRLGAKGYYNK